MGEILRKRDRRRDDGGRGRGKKLVKTPQGLKKNERLRRLEHNNVEVETNEMNRGSDEETSRERETEKTQLAQKSGN